MRSISRLSPGAVGLLLTGTLLGCAAHGPRYSEVIAGGKPLAGNEARIVLLRPDQRYDDYSLSKAVMRVNDSKVGKLAYGGFLLLDVDAGDVAIEASARNPMYGACELRFAVRPGDTVYLDVAPRTQNVVAGLAGSAVGAAAIGDGPTEIGVGEILIDKSTVPATAASAAGDAVASAAESAGRACGGPFKVTPIPASDALKHLDRLALSE